MHWVLYLVALACLMILAPVVFRALRRRQLEKMLNGSDQTDALAAIQLLGSLRDAKAVPALCQKLKDEKRLVRAQVASALGEIGDPSALESLIEALHDAEVPVRMAAAEALGHFADRRAVDALNRALKDEVESVRTSALRALGGVRGLG